MYCCLHFVIWLVTMIFVVGERYRVVTSYKYFRTKMFPCIFYMKAFFHNHYHFSIDIHEIFSIKSRNEYNFCFSHDVPIILFLPFHKI
jgi:hypothetical protein